MDIKWNKDTKRIEGVGSERFQPRGATTGFMELVVEAPGQAPVTLRAHHMKFGYMGPAALLETFFEADEEGSSLTFMFFKPLAANTAYLIGNPFIGGDADVLGSFHYIGEGGGGVGDGVLHITEFVQSNQGLGFTGRFRFHYNVEGGTVSVSCESFNVEHISD